MKAKQITELYRKSIHVSSLIIPLSYKYVFHFEKTPTFIFLLVLTVISLLVEILRYEHHGFKRIFYSLFGIMLRKHEINDFTGASYLLTSSVICVAFLEPRIAFVALSFLSIGDTFAALIGISWGKRKFLGKKKSLEGSLACFVTTFIWALFFIHPTLAFFGAVSTSLAELWDIPLDDNVKIPIISGITMSLINIII